MDVTTGSSVFPTSLFYQLIPPREALRSNLAPDRQYQTTTTTTILIEHAVNRCISSFDFIVVIFGN